MFKNGAARRAAPSLRSGQKEISGEEKILAARLEDEQFSAFGKELYYGTLLFCSGRWEVCHLRSEDISLYIRCLLSALQPWRGRARADDFWMRLRYGMPDPERMTRVVESWIAVQKAGL